MATLEDLSVDQLLAHARKLEGSASLLESISKNPETRSDLQRLIKKNNPSLIIPELETDARIEKEMKFRDTKIEELENRILEREVRERLEKQRSLTQQKYHLSDSEMVEVEKMMTDPDQNVRIPGYDAAARVLSAQKQSSVPTHTSVAPPTYSMPETDTWGKGIGNRNALDKIALTEAYQAWNEVRAGNVANG